MELLSAAVLMLVRDSNVPYLGDEGRVLRAVLKVRGEKR
jgi:hypothetical protein